MMKYYTLLLWLILASTGAQCVSRAFVCTDYTQGKVLVFNEQQQIVWEYPAKNCNDIWVLPNGHLLFNDGNSVKAVTLDKKVVWEYRSESDIYACQRLANGNTFIGECTGARLLEVSPDGTVVKSIRLLPEGQKASGGFMRNARRLENGHYLVAHYNLDKVCEYNQEGALVWEVPVTGGPHSVVRLPGGNTLVSCTDHSGAPGIVEFNPQKEVVWSVSADELPGISLKFVAGFQRLENGNTVITNWLGHNNLGKSAHALEITPGKKVVWSYQEHEKVKTMSSIFITEGAEPPLH
jgi:hypothetical protein